MLIKYYKSLLYDNTSLCGSLSSIFYPENQWVYAKVGKLFVFNSLQHAKDYAFGTRIYECQIRYPSIEEYIVDPLTKLTPVEFCNKVKQFWHTRDKTSLSFITKAPTGTICCGGLKLGRLVYVRNSYV